MTSDRDEWKKKIYCADRRPHVKVDGRRIMIYSVSIGHGPCYEEDNKLIGMDMEDMYITAYFDVLLTFADSCSLTARLAQCSNRLLHYELLV